MFSQISGGFVGNLDFTPAGLLAQAVGGDLTAFFSGDGSAVATSAALGNFQLFGLSGTSMGGPLPPDDDDFVYVQALDGNGDPVPFSYWKLALNQTVDQIYFDNSGLMLSNWSGDVAPLPTLANVLHATRLLDLVDTGRFQQIGGTEFDDLIFVGDFGSDVSGGDGNDILNGGAGVDTLSGNVGDDTISGGGGNDLMKGRVGNDLVYGGDGSDRLQGHEGNDFLSGGDGLDKAEYAQALAASNLSAITDADALTVGDQAGWQVNAGALGIDKLTGVEIVQFDGGRYLLVGNGGFADANAAGAAATQAGDVILFATPPPTVTIDQSGSADNLTVSFAGDTPVDVKTGSGNDHVTGGGGSDIISTGAGNDEVKAGAGDDTVNTGEGDDTIVGGAGNGNDIYDGGTGIDTAIYSSATSAIVVNLATGTASGAEIGTDTLHNIENVLGGQGNDAITGDGAANVLTGALGDDILAGGGGLDALTGGAGKDAFLFDTKPNKLTNLDHVTDFIHGTDKVRLDDDVFKDLDKGKLDKDAFFSGKLKHMDGEDRVLYDKVTGILSYDKDGSGHARAKAFAVLDGNPDDISHKDFLIVA